MVLSIDINGKAVRLSFGPHCVERYSAYIMGLDQSISVDAGDAFSSLILYANENYSKRSGEPVQVTKSEVYAAYEDWILSSDIEAQQKVADILKAYNESTLVKPLLDWAKTQDEGEKKKALTGKRLKRSASVK